MEYREVFNNKLKQISASVDSYLVPIEESCKSIVPNEITDLSVIKPTLDKLSKFKDTINGIRIEFDINKLSTIINAEYEARIAEVNKKRDDLVIELREKISELSDKKIEAAKQQNAEIRARNEDAKKQVEASNSKYIKLEQKRQRLLEYSTEILQMCSDNGIKVSDIAISNDTFSIDELNAFYDEFYTFIDKAVNRSHNPITWFRDITQDSSTALCVCAIVTCIIVYTPIFDILAISLICYIVFSQLRQKSLIKKYTVLAGLVFNVNPMEFDHIEELSDDMLEKEVPEEVDVENDKDIQDIYSTLSKEIASISDESIREEMAKAIAAFSNDYDSMNKEYADTIDRFEERKSNLLSVIEDLCSSISIKEQELKSQVKLLGTEFQTSGVLTTKVKLGIDPDTLIYETLDIGMQNIVFNTHNVDMKELDKFIKVLLANFYCNVRPGFLDVTVFDPNGMSRSMAGFYNEELDQLFRMANTDLNEILKELREYTDKVIHTTRGMSINDYNTEVSKDGRICLNYKLLIVLSQPKSVEEDEALSKFMEYSADLGVFVWMVTDSTFAKTRVFKKPFEGINQPIDIDPFEFPIMVTTNLLDAFNNLVSPILSWTAVKEKIIPDDKTWTYNADEFIDLDPGFEDGDPSRTKGYTVGHTGDVHALCVGGTGAGKSVFINNLIVNVCSKYSPRDVGLWLVDFKGTEFNFYLKNERIGITNCLPHIEACLCTSDPDYSVTLFHHIREMCDDRYAFIKHEGFKDVFKYNKTMRKNGTPEKCLKRILVVVDEFQVIFTKTDNKAQQILTADITQIAKVARAAGIHMVFSSQSLKGTVSDDILAQFTLRFGLRCDMDVSKAIMGTPYSGDIREKNGYLYVASSDDKKRELQKRYRTPFLEDEVLRERINFLCHKAEVEGYVREEEPIMYDETIEHPIEELDNLFETELKGANTKGLFVFGERMTYSTKGRRANTYLSRENNQNIFSSFSNTKDAVMFFNTLMHNLQHNGGGQFIFNSSLKDLAYLCEVDKYIDDTNRFFIDDTQTPAVMFKFLTDVKTAREKVEDPSTLAPLYIILLGWDKALQFGVDTNYKVTEPYTVMLQTCGVVHMHFIFLTSGLGEIPKGIVSSCRYRIAGKVDEKTSNTLVDSDAAYKNYDQKSGYMFYFTDGERERLKIYQTPITRTIEESFVRI